ncbi:helix-turn-helix domain-containing protein [Brevibacterium album]|uniref:helix-turn-helix domain-containing protein n=1 Tax=Brevibacterium album TaxID=417948 RepID=UPI0003F57674|nr:GAF domain-containing protein [Brevibacterium album]
MSSADSGSQQRTSELEALLETAGELSSLHHVDDVLGAIVQRARQLLFSDVAYLMLLDDERRTAHMRVSSGIQTQGFLGIRVDYGEGLAGLVASTGMPQWTEDYRSDERFAPKIGEIVRAESLRSLLGVPLTVGRRVIGVLFAADRESRAYSHREVALLASLADHAAIALDNAEMHEQTQQVLARWRTASEEFAEQNRALERASEFHERLMGLMAAGVPLGELAAAAGDFLGGVVVVLSGEGGLLTPAGEGVRLPGQDELEVCADLDERGSAQLPADEGEAEVRRLAAVRAGSRRLGYVLYQGPELAPTDVRSFERAAMVTALMILHTRADEEARKRVMGELISELISARADADWVRSRAESAGIVLSPPPYVAVVAVEGSRPGAADRLDAAVQLANERGGLARVQAGETVLLVSGESASETADGIARALDQRFRVSAAVGGDGPHASLHEAARAISRSRTCAKVLAMTGRWSHGAAPEDIGLYALLFSEVGRAQIDDFVAETLGPLMEYDAVRGSRLLDTVRAHFDTGGQTGALAEALMIHVNTLYQRLARIDQLLGSDWRVGEASLQVHLALRLRDLVDGDD